MNNFDFAVNTLWEGRTIIARLNLNTEQVSFIKFETENMPLNTWMPFREIVQDAIKHGRILPEDVSTLERELDPVELRKKCTSCEGGTLLHYRRVVNGELQWTKVILSIPHDYSSESPDVLLCWRPLSSQEANVQDAFRIIRDHVQKLVKIDFLNGTYQILRAPESENYLRYRRPCEGILEEEAFVHPDDLLDFRAETERDHVIAYFAAGNSEKTVYYRRKSGSFYRWVKLIFRMASEYREEHPVFLYSVIDVNSAMIQIFMDKGRRDFLNRHREHTEQVESYYQNILRVMSFFTQQYLDFYIVDLEKDQYIKYKINRPALSGEIPYVGSYTEIGQQYMEKMVRSPEMERLRCFASSKGLQEVLEDKVSCEYRFTSQDGRQCRTVCTKIESKQGMPTKVLCRIMECKPESLLRVKTFGNFQVFDRSGKPIRFSKKKAQQLLAYLVDKHGFPVSTADIVMDVLEKPMDDLNAKKYVSALFRSAEKDLAQAGYTGVIVKEWNSLRVNVAALDCDYYHLIDGDASYWSEYHNEYMKEYSWAEETNAEILHYGSN